MPGAGEPDAAIPAADSGALVDSSDGGVDGEPGDDGGSEGAALDAQSPDGADGGVPDGAMPDGANVDGPDSDGSISDGGDASAEDAEASAAFCGSAQGTTVTTAAELQALAGCTTIVGSLTLEATVPDFAPLYALEHVTGDLIIMTGASLHGLEHLAFVDGVLDLWEYVTTNTDPLDALTTVGGLGVNAKALQTLRLPHLTHAGSVSIQDISALTEVSLPALTATGGFELFSLPALTTLLAPALTTVDGDLTLMIVGLTSVGTFGALTSVGGILTVANNPSLPQIDGFAKVTKVGGELCIVNDASLTSLEGFHSITSVGSLKIDTLPMLTSLEGLRALATEVGSPSYDFASVAFLPRVKDLTGLRSLQAVHGGLNIDTMAGLTSLHGLEALTSVGQELDITNNPALVHLTGLDGLTTMGPQQIVVADNNALLTFGSLNALTHFGSYGGFDIHDNAALQSIDGVRSLRTIGGMGNINIWDEPQLTSLDGFDALETVYEIDVVGSWKVATLRAFGSLVLVTGKLLIDLSGLTTLAAFDNLARVDGDFTLVAPPLTSYAGLGSLESVGGALTLGETSVTTLADLVSLRKVGGAFSVNLEKNLVHVNVLPHLSSVGSLTIEQDPALPTCDAENLLAALRAQGFQGTATITQDGSGPCI